MSITLHDVETMQRYFHKMIGDRIKFEIDEPLIEFKISPGRIQGHYSPRRHVCTYNQVYLALLSTEEIADLVAHEVSHAWQYKLNGGKNEKHGSLFWFFYVTVCERPRHRTSIATKANSRLVRAKVASLLRVKEKINEA